MQLISSGRMNWAAWLLPRVMTRTQRIRCVLNALELALMKFEANNIGLKHGSELADKLRTVLRDDIAFNRVIAVAAGAEISDACEYADLDSIAFYAAATVNLEPTHELTDAEHVTEYTFAYLDANTANATDPVCLNILTYGVMLLKAS